MTEFIFLLGVLKDIHPVVTFFESKEKGFMYSDYKPLLKNILNSIEMINHDDYYKLIKDLNDKINPVKQ